MFENFTDFPKAFAFLQFLFLHVDLDIIKVDLAVLDHSERQFLFDRLWLESFTLIRDEIALDLFGLFVPGPNHK